MLLAPSSPSAVSGLLASLTGGAPPSSDYGQSSYPSGGMLAPPSGSSAPSAPSQPSMADRVRGILGVRAPAGFQGLLSPEEIDSAKPSILQTLIGAPGGPSASDAYRQRLEHMLQMKQIASQTAEHARIINSRRAMADMFPITGSESVDQLRQKLGAMYAYSMSHGDEEAMKDIGSRLASVLAVPKAVEPTKIPNAQGTGTNAGKTVTQLRYPDGRMEEVPEGAAPKNEPQYEPKLFSDGKGGFAWVKPGTSTPKGFAPFAAKSTTQNAQQSAAEGLLRSSVSEMNNADAFMKSYEDRLAKGEININGLSQFLGGLGNAFTHDDPASRAIQNTALTTLNKVNPDLARYIRRGLSFAEGEAGISKRPSDFRTKMAAFLSTAASGASPDMITDIQSRRNSILTPLNSVVSKMGDGNPTSSPAATGKTRPALQERIQQLKAQGVSKERAKALLSAEGYSIQ